MDKREMIERALRGSLPDAFYWNWSTLSNALAGQAIVIECEVEHFTPKVSPSAPYTQVYIEDHDGEAHSMSFDGLQGREGKAIAIILSLGEDFEEFIMRETAAAVEGGIIDENTGLPFELGDE